MEEQQQPVNAKQEVERIVRTARMMGVDVNETDVAHWLTAMVAAEATEGDLAVDDEAGIYGHEITLLDFDRATLER